MIVTLALNEGHVQNAKLWEDIAAFVVADRERGSQRTSLEWHMFISEDWMDQKNNRLEIAASFEDGLAR